MRQPRSRRLVAALCIAALFFGAVVPAAAALFVAVIVPLPPLFGTIVVVDVPLPESVHPAPFPVRSALPTRAPPA